MKWKHFGQVEPECWLDVTARHVAPDVAAEKIATITRMMGGVEKDVDALEIECVRKGSKAEVHRWYGASLEWEVEWQSLADIPDERIDIGGEKFVPVEFDLGFPVGLAWHYQPVLTQAEIDEGSERPENVVGSYAVYWHHAGRILDAGGEERVNYATGKFCHLYRPQLIDANGDTAWAQMVVRETLDPAELVVYMPVSWLMSAAYPVILDPTFGYTSIGGTSFNIGSADWALGDEATPTSSGTVQTLHVYCKASSGTTNITGGIYDNAATGNLLTNGATGEISVDITPSWNTLTFGTDPSVTGSTEYRMAWHQGAGVTGYYDVVGGAGAYDDDETYSGGSMPDPMAWDNTAYDRRISIYATYTASGVGNPWYYYQQQAVAAGAA